MQWLHFELAFMRRSVFERKNECDEVLANLHSDGCHPFHVTYSSALISALSSLGIPRQNGDRRTVGRENWGGSDANSERH